MKKAKNIILNSSLIIASIAATCSAVKVIKSFKGFNDAIKSIDFKTTRMDINELIDTIILRNDK